LRVGGWKGEGSFLERKRKLRAKNKKARPGDNSGEGKGLQNDRPAGDTRDGGRGKKKRSYEKCATEPKTTKENGNSFETGLVDGTSSRSPRAYRGE